MAVVVQEGRGAERKACARGKGADLLHAPRTRCLTCSVIVTVHTASSSPFQTLSVSTALTTSSATLRTADGENLEHGKVWHMCGSQEGSHKTCKDIALARGTSVSNDSCGRP